MPGSPSRFENRDLASATNPLRLIRDRRANVSRKPPLLVLANGDVLTGLPTELEPDLGRVAHVPRVKIQLEPPLMPVTGTVVPIRTDRVLRIMLTDGAAAGRTESGPMPPPGMVVLADGRRLVARSIRWRQYGLALLTGDGVVEADFGDLADVVFPHVDLSAAVLEDRRSK